MGGGRVRG